MGLTLAGSNVEGDELPHDWHRGLCINLFCLLSW